MKEVSMVVSTRITPSTLRKVGMVVERMGYDNVTRGTTLSLAFELVASAADSYGIEEVGDGEARDWVLRKWPELGKSKGNMTRMALAAEREGMVDRMKGEMKMRREQWQPGDTVVTEDMVAAALSEMEKGEG